MPDAIDIKAARALAGRLEQERDRLRRGSSNPLASVHAEEAMHKAAATILALATDRELLQWYKAQLFHIVDLTHAPNPSDPNRWYIAPGKSLTFSNAIAAVRDGRNRPLPPAPLSGE